MCQDLRSNKDRAETFQLRHSSTDLTEMCQDRQRIEAVHSELIRHKTVDVQALHLQAEVLIVNTDANKKTAINSDSGFLLKNFLLLRKKLPF